MIYYVFYSYICIIISNILILLNQTHAVWASVVIVQEKVDFFLNKRLKLFLIFVIRVDDLYGFLQLWVAHLYGPLDVDQVSSRGYELVESDTELWEDESPTGTDKDKEKDKSGTPSELADLTRESWEVRFDASSIFYFFLFFLREISICLTFRVQTLVIKMINQ